MPSGVMSGERGGLSVRRLDMVGSARGRAVCRILPRRSEKM
jgi:hypothetical protein